MVGEHIVGAKPHPFISERDRAVTYRGDQHTGGGMMWVWWGNILWGQNPTHLLVRGIQQ